MSSPGSASIFQPSGVVAAQRSGQPALVKRGRLEVGVVHRLQHRGDLVGRLALDLEVGDGSSSGRVNTSPWKTLQLLARQADEPFDVVHLPVAGELEHDDVPPLGLAEVEAVLVHQDAVAGVAGLRLDLVEVGQRSTSSSAARGRSAVYGIG